MRTGDGGDETVPMHRGWGTRDRPHAQGTWDHRRAEGMGDTALSPCTGDGGHGTVLTDRGWGTWHCPHAQGMGDTGPSSCGSRFFVRGHERPRPVVTAPGGGGRKGPPVPRREATAGGGWGDTYTHNGPSRHGGDTQPDPDGWQGVGDSMAWPRAGSGPGGGRGGKPPWPYSIPPHPASAPGSGASWDTLSPHPQRWKMERGGDWMGPGYGHPPVPLTTRHPQSIVTHCCDELVESQHILRGGGGHG